MTAAMTKALDLHTPKGELPAHPSPAQVAAFRKANQLRASLSDDSWPAKVAAFRRLYGLSEHDSPFPALISMSRMMLHRGLLREELTEIEDAIDTSDLDGIVDGVLDLIYVGLGFLCELGLKPQQQLLAMQEVHASNMTKTDDAGAPVFNTDGKVLKGDNYQPVDLHTMLVNWSVGLSAEGGEQADG